MLITPHGVFEDLCSEFHKWRVAIALAAGFKTERDVLGTGNVLNWDWTTDANTRGKWVRPPDDPSS
jgi:hypothetical protein